jgi:hypothetical protein
MSNIFISNIVGVNQWAIPESDSDLVGATLAMTNIALSVMGLSYSRLLAWVEDWNGPGGAEGVRTLNCLIGNFEFDSGGGAEQCPTETDIDTLGGLFDAAFAMDVDVTSVGIMRFSLFNTDSSYYLWERTQYMGYRILHPVVDTDDIAVGGAVSPTGRFFDNGEMSIGTSVMSGNEVLYVLDTNSTTSSLGIYYYLVKTGADDKQGWIGNLSTVEHLSGSCSTGYTGFRGECDFSPALGTDTLSIWMGFEEKFAVSDGTVNEASGFTAYCNCVDGDITYREGLYAMTPTTPASVKNCYGVYIGEQWAISASDAYGIYQNGATNINYFEGELLEGSVTAYNASVGIEINSTTMALVPSNLTEGQRDALDAVVGMLIWYADVANPRLQVCTGAGTPGTWSDLAL